MRISSFEQKSLWTAVVVMIIYLSPLFILGQDAHIRVHDNLDSNIVWYKVLIQSGEWFGSISAVIPQVINGLQRNAMGTEFSGIVVLHAFFPAMAAYAWSQTITRVFAFLGMYLLLKDHLVPDSDATWIRVGVALTFALTPFWPSGMLSTLGQPLALWAFLNIRKGSWTWKEWFIIIALPFYSSLVLGFFFFQTAIALVWVWDTIMNKRWNLPFLGSVFLMGLVYLAIEYRLLASLVITNTPTNRNEFVSSRLNVWQCARLTVKNFIFGHHHVGTVHTWIILPLMVLTVYFCIVNQQWRKDSTSRLFIILFVLNVALSTWYAFWFHTVWQPLKEQFELLTTFNFARFHFLRPLVIYMGFAAGCVLLWRKGGSKGRLLTKLAVAGQIILLFAYNEEIMYRSANKPSFRQFYAEEQFQEIGEYIGEPKASYRVASIGLHPAIAQYNGFYTLDTYNNFYSLSYKHTFREIIAKELDKSKKLKTYFDTWGGRCYLFVAELGKKYDYSKTSKKQIRNLELNTDVFKKLGGKYIFSSVPIRNASSNRLLLRKTFNHEHSAWKVYLYEVK
ncbi:DUF6044 family protein [Paenibacillus sedimenti]|uniref:YkoS n=1 Tax=Paenibacillus sedimenti TaxID=2770274 RepID=A0A926QHS2_9BACL|nr:DUF6044 family protein [Paenibacillus sedimenti]MBD0378823.1 hypothetical protein [Paenibacillus sedimenti]